jgi:hypothetical protein
MTPNLTDFPFDFYIEFDIIRGHKATHDDDGAPDFIKVTDVYLHSVEVKDSVIKHVIEVYVNNHHESLGLYFYGHTLE